MVNINSHPKAQHTAPKMEDIVINEPMAISLNPVKEADPRHPLQVFIKSQYNYLSEHAESGGYKMLLWPEASPIGRVHMHGLIAITDIHKWIQKGVILLKDLNSFAIKKFFKRESKEDEEDEHTSGEDKWREYCEKQKHIWKPLFNNSVLDYPMSIRFKSEEGEGGSPEGAPPSLPSTIEPRAQFKIEEPKLKRKPTIRVKAQAP